LKRPAELQVTFVFGEGILRAFQIEQYVGKHFAHRDVHFSLSAFVLKIGSFVHQAEGFRDDTLVSPSGASSMNRFITLGVLTGSVAIAATAASPDVTFNRDILPLLQKNC
jgi:hypothetical protein